MSNYRLYGDVQIVLHTCQTKTVWGCSKCVIYMSNYRLYGDVQNVLYTCQTIGCLVMFKMCYNTCQTNTETNTFFQGLKLKKNNHRFINAGMLSVPYFFHTKYQECAFKEDKQRFTENMIEISEQANNIVIHSIFGKCKISSACLVRRCGVQTFKSIYTMSVLTLERSR